MNIGFVSTRFAGVDGVSLEANKWAEVLEANGHSCFWFAGELDHPAHSSYLVQEAHFHYPCNQAINREVFGRTRRSAATTEQIHALRASLKQYLQRFLSIFKIDLLIAENALTIPMNIPLGLALAEIISETQIPTIAHHHDFYWERTRFAVNAVGEYLQMGFPPRLPNIEHVVINSSARETLAHRTGLSATVIPNVLNYDSPSRVNQTRGKAFRDYMGLSPEDILVLQPTRIIRRKGIERAIDLVQQLNDDRVKLVISHEAGDEGFAYADWIEAYARQNGIDLRLVRTRIGDPLCAGSAADDFNLWDVYAQADLVTYPSWCEGFGNAFLEAVYWKKPILINRYATFVKDIEPLGFDLMVMEGFVTSKTVAQVQTILSRPDLRDQIVEHNYNLARKHFSYTRLQRTLEFIVDQLLGRDSQPPPSFAMGTENRLALNPPAAQDGQRLSLVANN
jgi:glycosyltransferase involved in cell wall biosynthesis